MDLIPGPAARVFSRTCAWCFLAPPVWTRVRVVPKVSEPFEHRMPNPNQYQNAWTKNKSGPVNRSSPCNLKPTTFNIGRHVHEIALLEGWGAGICIVYFHTKFIVLNYDLETQTAGWK